MDVARVLSERLRSHRIAAPAETVETAASALLAVQAQEFWGGRWGLALRTQGTPGLSAVDAAFDRGALVRSWTMRGTLHVVPARDLGWLLDLTGERQFRAAASRHRRLGIDEDLLAATERAVRAALRGGGRMSRAALFDLVRTLGVDPGGQVGAHLLYALAVRQVVVQGAVIAREGGPTREQWFLLTEDAVREDVRPADPLAELAVRFVDGHGPAGAADLAWWSGLPLGTARSAIASAGARLDEVAEGLFVTRPRPAADPAAADVVALPPFDEYFLSYADRTVACPRELLPDLAQGGMMRPTLLAGGRIVGWWARASGEVQVSAPEVSAEEAAAAVVRFHRFPEG